MVTTCLPIWPFGDFRDAKGQLTHIIRGQIWPNFEHIRDLVVVLVTSKNEKDPVKNEGTRVVTSVSPF